MGPNPMWLVSLGDYDRDPEERPCEDTGRRQASVN